MNNILVINLTRLGDIIQSIGLLRGLKKKYPNCKIDFLAMSSFAGILSNIDGIDEIISLDDKSLVDNIHSDFWGGYEELQTKIDYLNSKNYDLLVNPIMSLQSSYLSTLIDAKEKRGMIITADGEQSVKSDWSSFLLSNQHNLGDHSFNLVNIFAGIAGTSFDIADYHIKTDKKIDVNLGDGKYRIGFHVGASQSNKTWPIEYFKEVISVLVKNTEYELFLFGGYKETDVKDYFNDIKQDNFHNWIGKFKLDELISAISLMDLFVTNDTGPMHIAACVKVPIINLSLGPVSMWETGAYSEKVIALQADIDCHPCSFSYICPHWNCHYMIIPAAVIGLIEKKFNPNTKDLYFKNVLYWKSIVDLFGYIHWVPLTKRQIREKELLFELKRCIWAITLNNTFHNQEIIVKEYMQFINNHYDRGDYNYEQIKQASQILLAYCQQIIMYLREIVILSRNIKNNLDKIKSIWSNVISLKNTMFIQAKEHSVIYDWFLHLSFTESQLEIEDLGELTKETISLYEKLSKQLKLLTELIDYY